MYVYKRFTWSVSLNKYEIHAQFMIHTEISKQWKNQDLTWNTTNKLISFK